MLPNVPVEIEFYGDEVIGLELPGSVELKVTETQPAVKGGTVAGGGKPATLETGLVVTVPDFVKDGETIIVTTDTGTYKGRAQK
jgi:elongation factor P